MTTRFESELQDIEHRLRNPAKSAKVHPAEKQHLDEQRRRESMRTQLTKELSGEIRCQWLDGEPRKWEPARASVTIGKHSDIFEVDPMEFVEGRSRVKSSIVREGYNATVERWALWKWNTMRGAEIDDREQYIVEVDPPAFVWAEALPR